MAGTAGDALRHPDRFSREVADVINAIQNAISGDVTISVGSTYSIGNTDGPSLLLNVCVINVLCANNDQSIGTTTTHALKLKTANVNRWQVDSNGNLLPYTTHDIGSSGSRIGTLYGTSIDATTFSGSLNEPVTSKAAAGNSQGTATAITSRITIVSTSSITTQGVILPDSAPTGSAWKVVNANEDPLNGVDVYVYPPSGHRFLTAPGASANNPVSVPYGGGSIEFVKGSSSTWYVFKGWPDDT